MARDIVCGHHCWWTSGRPGNGLGWRTGPRECDDQALAVPSGGRKSICGGVRMEHWGLRDINTYGTFARPRLHS